MDIDLTTLISNPATMAWVVAAIIAFLRKRIPAFKGDLVVVGAVILALALMILVPFIPENFLSSLGAAIGIGLTASGTVDLVKGVGVSVSKTMKGL